MGKKRYVQPEFKQYDSAFEALEAMNNPNRTMTSSDYFGAAANPIFRGYNTGYGDSSYDDNLNWDAEVDPNNVRGSINEHRSREQGWWATAGAGLGRTLTKAGIEGVKTGAVIGGAIIGAAGQIGDAVSGQDNTDFLETTFNNSAVKALDGVNEDVKKNLLPVYVGKATEEGGLMAKLGSIEFWANEGADGLGFALGMMIPGAAISKIGVGARLLNGSRKLANLAKITNRTDTAVDALNTVGAAGRKIDNAVSITANTFAESGAEAKGFADSFDKNKDKFVSNRMMSIYEQSRQTPEYMNEPEMIQGKMELVKTPDGRTVMRSQGLIPNPKLEALKQESLKMAEGEFNEQRAAGMRNVFLANAAILVGPNALMHNALFGAKTAKKLADPVKAGWKGVAQRVNASGQRYGTALLSEGLWEEGTQGATEKYFHDKAMKGKIAKDFFSKETFKDLDQDFVDGAKQYTKGLGTTEGQIGVVLGAVFGGMMTSTFGRAQDKRDQKESDKVRATTKTMGDIYSVIRDNDIYLEDPAKPGEPIFKKDANGNVTNVREVDLKKVAEVANAYGVLGKMKAEYEEAVANDDTNKIEELRDKMSTQVAMSTALQGEIGVAGLQEYLSNVVDNLDPEKYSAEDVKDIKKRHEQLLSRTQELVEINNKFDDFAPDLISLKQIPGMTTELAQKYRDALKVNYLELKDRSNINKSKIKELQKERKNIYDDVEDEAIYSVTGKNKITRLKDKLNFTNLKNIRTKLLSTIDPTFDFSEEGKKLNQELLDLSEEEKRLNDEIDEMIKNHPKIADIDDQITSLNESVSKDKSELAKIWRAGKDNANIDDLRAFILQQRKIEKTLSRDSQIEIQETIDQINSFNEDEIDDLIDYFNSLRDELKNNQYVKNAYLTKYKELQDIINSKQQGQPPVVNNDVEDLPDNEEDNETKETSEEDIIDDNAKNEATGGTKVISTFYYNPKTEPVKALDNGQKLFNDIPDEYIEYERNGQSKIGDEVSFEVTDTDVDTAAIKVIVKDKLTGKTTYSFLQGKPVDHAQDSAKEYYNNKVRPIREAIVTAISNGVPVSEIRSKILSQMQGKLTVEPQIVTSQGIKTPTNSIADLDIFHQLGITNNPDKIARYVHNNSYYVNKKGQMLSVKDDSLHTGVIGKTYTDIGGVFLNIKQANGSNYLLKLNPKRIDTVKANAIYELFRALSLESKNVANPTKIQTQNIDKFLNDLKQSDVNVYNEVLSAITTEIELLKKVYTNVGEQTVEKLLDILVYQKSNNDKTKLKLSPDGSLDVGTLASISGLGKVITSENFANRDRKNEFADYLKNKRHNVLITMDPLINMSKSKSYVNYLITQQILNTNAVVNKYDENRNLIERNPTFQGNAYIYIDPIITDSKGNKIVNKNSSSGSGFSQTTPTTVTPTATVTPTTTFEPITVFDFMDNTDLQFEVNSVLEKYEADIPDNLSPNEEINYRVKTYNDIMSIQPLNSSISKDTEETPTASEIQTKSVKITVEDLNNDEVLSTVFDIIEKYAPGENVTTLEDIVETFNNIESEIDSIYLDKICKIN